MQKEIHDEIFKQNKNRIFSSCDVDSSSCRTDSYPVFSLLFYASSVSAGFPSPADDHVQRHIDLNEELVTHPAATFFVRIKRSHLPLGPIQEEDVLIVDRSLRPKSGDLVVAILNSEFTIKRLSIKNNHLKICSAYGKEHFVFLDKQELEVGKELSISKDMDFCIWGVVKTVIHNFR